MVELRWTLDAGDAELLVDALNLLRQQLRRPVPGLDEITGRLRSVTATNANLSRLEPQNTTANANFLLTQQVSDHDASREWITSAQAGEILGRTPDAVRAAARRGRLPCRRRGGRWEFNRELIEQRAGRRVPVWPLL